MLQKVETGLSEKKKIQIIMSTLKTCYWAVFAAKHLIFFYTMFSISGKNNKKKEVKQTLFMLSCSPGIRQMFYIADLK